MNLKTKRDKKRSLVHQTAPELLKPYIIIISIKQYNIFFYFRQINIKEMLMPQARECRVK